MNRTARTLAFLLLVLVAPFACGATLTYKQIQLIDPGNVPLTDITSIEVYAAGTTTASTLWKTREGTQEITNPLTSTSTNTTFDPSRGIASWWSTGQTYAVKITGTSWSCTLDDVSASQRMIVITEEMRSVSLTLDAASITIQESGGDTCTWAVDGTDTTLTTTDGYISLVSLDGVKLTQNSDTFIIACDGDDTNLTTSDGYITLATIDGLKITDASDSLIFSSDGTDWTGTLSDGYFVLASPDGLKLSQNSDTATFVLDGDDLIVTPSDGYFSVVAPDGFKLTDNSDTLSIYADGTQVKYTTSDGGHVFDTALVTTGVLGSELVTNGTFTTDLTGWAGANWSNDANTALHTAGAVTALTQNITVSKGSTYQIEWTSAGRTAGSYTVDAGAVSVINDGASASFVSNATYKRSFVAGATGAVSLAFTPTTDFDGSLDNVTVKLITASEAQFAILDDSDAVAIEMRGDAGLYNQFVGLNSGRMNTTGSYNTANGSYALYSNTTGSYNTANGRSALRSNTTGSYNTANGSYALYSNTTGSNNTANGYYALNSNTTGSENTANGSYALYSNTTGSYNTANGRSALRSNTTGSYNTANGYYAGRYHANGSTALTDPEDSIYIGYDARGKDNDDSYSIVIGRSAIGKGANTTVLGTAGTTTATYLYGNINVGNVAYTGTPVRALMLADGNEPLTCTAGSGIVSKSGELYAFDAGGTDALLTNDRESEYYDPNYGRYIPTATIKSNAYLGIEQRIDLYKLAKLVEGLTGEKIIYATEIEKADWDKEQAKLVAEQQAKIDLLTQTVADLQAQIADANDADKVELQDKADAIVIPSAYKAKTKPQWITEAENAIVDRH